MENIEKIREYLSKNNISKTSDIAEYIGLSLPRTRAILKEIPDIDKKMINIAYLKKEQVTLIDLENYLRSKFEQDNDILKNSKPFTRTNLRRLIRIYDYLKGESKKASD